MLTSYLGVRLERAGPEGTVRHVNGHPSVAEWLCTLTQACSFLVYIRGDGRRFLSDTMDNNSRFLYTLSVRREQLHKIHNIIVTVCS